MNIDDIKSKIEKIEGAKGDYEVAHAMEDALYHLVLQDIAFGNHTLEECQNMASEALKTADISFTRYCA